MTFRLRPLIILLVIVLVSLGISVWLNGMGAVRAQSDGVDLGVLQLTGQQWGPGTGSALLVRPHNRGRSEILLIPNGVDDFGIGGELTIFNNDWIADPSNAELMVMRGQPNLGFVFQVQATGNGRQRPILMDAMGGWPTFAVNPNGTVGIRRGISNTEFGGGFSHGRFAACNNAQICQTHINWQINFPDTNYTLSCSLENAWGFVSVLQKETSGATLGITHYSAGIQTSGIVNCIAVHD